MFGKLFYIPPELFLPHMRRILIIGVILVGAWFVFQELNAPKEVDVNTEETTTEEGVVTEEGATEEKEEKKKEVKREPINKEGLVEKPVVVPTKVVAKPSVVVPSAVEEKTLKSSETPALHVTDTVKVFLYEWGIDLSTANVEAGNIAFEVFNNGQFTHYFGIKGGEEFGKVVPGELAVFVAPLEEGTMTLYSPRQIDMANKMQETLYVQ